MQPFILEITNSYFCLYKLKYAKKKLLTFIYIIAKLSTVFQRNRISFIFGTKTKEYKMASGIYCTKNIIYNYNFFFYVIAKGLPSKIQEQTNNFKNYILHQLQIP
jgi:hypothetical protein